MLPANQQIQQHFDTDAAVIPDARMLNEELPHRWHRNLVLQPPCFQVIRARFAGNPDSAICLQPAFLNPLRHRFTRDAQR